MQHQPPAILEGLGKWHAAICTKELQHHCGCGQRAQPSESSKHAQLHRATSRLQTCGQLPESVAPLRDGITRRRSPKRRQKSMSRRLLLRARAGAVKTPAEAPSAVDRGIRFRVEHRKVPRLCGVQSDWWLQPWCADARRGDFRAGAQPELDFHARSAGTLHIRAALPLVAIALFKSGPLILTMVFLWKGHWREPVRSHMAGATLPLSFSVATEQRGQRDERRYTSDELVDSKTNWGLNRGIATRMNSRRTRRGRYASTPRQSL